MRGYYGSPSLVGANGRSPNHDGGSLARIERDYKAALELAQRTPGDFIGLLSSQPVDDGGVLLDEPSDLKAIALPSRAALDGWFESITYETRAPGYSHSVMAIDKTKPMTVMYDGTKIPYVLHSKTQSVPRAKPASSSLPATNPFVWLVTAVIGAATAGKGHRALGFVGGGVVSAVVEQTLRRISP